MKLKLKDFSSFLNEEADVRKNTGLPSDFTGNAEEAARRNLGVTPDQPKQLELGTLLMQAGQIISQSIPLDQIEEKFTKLEEIASDVIKEEFKTVFEILPIELKLRLVRPNETVFGHLPELGAKQTDSYDKPEHSETEKTPVENSQETPEETQSNREEDDFFSFFNDDSQEEQQESEEENLEEIINQEPEVTNKDVAMAIDKTQILNMITQGAGKATKDIIKFSEIVSKGIGEIFGDNAQRILDIWGKISEEADKRDWVTPIDVTKNLFKDSPRGMAGAVKVDFFENYNLKFKKSELIIESGNTSKITIRAFGVDFPMLLHEAVKGIYMALQSPAIKKNPELAEEIKRATSSYKDEASDFRYGPPAQQMFRDFVNHCKDAGRYPNMVERVFFFLARDKEVIQKLPDMSEEEFELKNRQNGKFSDEEFLKITESIFSVFDKQNIGGKLKFVINEERFVESIARTKIEEII